MNAFRLSAFGAALVAGGVAAYLATEKPEPIPVQAEQIDMGEVLVAAVDIAMGSHVASEKVRWQAWPNAAISDGMITKASTPNASADLAGAISRGAFMAGEPIRRDKVIKGDAGFLSAILPGGKRALAINIDSRGANSAGGFILPNDKVDLVRTFTPEGPSGQAGAAVASETILKNVRVLAIGQNIEEKNGEKVVVGETATLELDPRQVEIVVLAQRQGPLSLSLRSLLDAAKLDEEIKPDEGKITIVRSGIASQR